MAPLKFEEQMKEKLDQRKIKPSDRAWEAIASQMHSTKDSKRKRAYFSYGIAAGFIGIILISAIYFLDRDVNNNAPYNVVDTEKVTVPLEKETPIKSEANQEIVFEIEESLSEENESINAMGTAAVKVENKKNYSKASSYSDASRDSAQHKKTKEKVVLPTQTNNAINTKIVQLVEKMDWLEQNKIEVTSAEIDSLLRSAQQEILQERLFQKDQSVDAMTLLSQVENELDQSFRDQIFDALKDGFLKVRTAVATRNE